MTSGLVEREAQQLAVHDGHGCGVSRDIAGNLSFGFGMVDDYGFFEKPCIVVTTLNTKRNGEPDVVQAWHVVERIMGEEAFMTRCNWLASRRYFLPFQRYEEKNFESLADVTPEKIQRRELKRGWICQTCSRRTIW